MVKIIDKLRRHLKEDQQKQPPYFSLEFFPPKTDIGVENLYLRIERMTALQPVFVDITWGAGGSTKDLTLAISEYTQTYCGVEALMHLTCTNMTIEELKQVLRTARQAGIENILALRGDPPKGALSWEPYPGGCNNALELVQLIREEHGDYFGIAVAGFPEGHPLTADGNYAQDIVHLKEKIDAGADFVLTQFFYDPCVFLEYFSNCRAAGITCPIIPGMMPIQSYPSFVKLAQYGKSRVPDKIWQDLNPIRDNDAAVKEYGVTLCLDMCKTLRNTGDVNGFHFYTLNLENSVMGVLDGLQVGDACASRRALPWRRPTSRENSHSHALYDGKTSTSNNNHNNSNITGKYSSSQKGGGGGGGGGADTGEDVRPINWANRPKSYIKRTETWDEFPNGRWGDGRSPAFGDLEGNYGRSLESGRASKEDRLAMWGEAPITPEEIFTTFAQYIEGKIPALPWCEVPLQAETSLVRKPITSINLNGYLTINSQPAVNGERSDHTVFGWGGPGGRVYQKAYLEFFTSSDNLDQVRALVQRNPNLVFYAVNYNGDVVCSGAKGVTALTWGVFPNKEILQPTVFALDTYVVWSKEAFALWTDVWAYLYDDETDSSALLYEIRDTYYLIAIIDNDYIDSSLFSVVEELTKK